MSLQNTIIVTAIILWFANGWYLNERLNLVHKKLDKTLYTLDGLRKYLYEIDPQFDLERFMYKMYMEESDNSCASEGYAWSKFKDEKEQSGKRTLDTRFYNSNDV